jgi:hypothetical protein
MKSPRPDRSAVLASVARTRSAVRGIPYREALMEVAHENPDLAASARLDVLGEACPFEPAGSLGLRLVLASEVHTLSDDPAERLAQIAGLRAREKQIPYFVALSEVNRECPELAHAARLRVLGKRQV